jgi:pimeloyl-ACP methyl ester carboxylesterase
MPHAEDSSRRSSRKLLALALGVPVLAAGAWFAYSALAVPHRLPLPPALTGKRRETHGRAGRLSHYVAGSGAPVLLIHSINAAGSAYEVRPIFERISTQRQAYALDLPGFGFSDRSRRRYDVQLYVDAILDLLDVIADEHGDEPVDALALSLSSEFLARAALERPARFRTLTLVAPTGFKRRDSRRVGPPGSTREVRGFEAIVANPPWDRALFDLLSSSPSIRFFLERTFGSSHIDQGLKHYDYLTSHQPGAQHAAYAFLSGRLFSRDIRRVYERLTLPIWVPHGARGGFGDLRGARWAERLSNWHFREFDSGALPFFERPREFMRELYAFLANAVPYPKYADRPLNAPYS